jgi:hypothetical protein
MLAMEKPIFTISTTWEWLMLITFFTNVFRRTLEHTHMNDRTKSDTTTILFLPIFNDKSNKRLFEIWINDDIFVFGIWIKKTKFYIDICSNKNGVMVLDKWHWWVKKSMQRLSKKVCHVNVTMRLTFYFLFHYINYV